MTALIILCAIALFIALILLIPLGIHLRYDGEIALDANVAFVRLHLLPKRQKKIKLRKFSKKKFEKMLAKERKKEQKKTEKKAAKSAAKPKAAQSKSVEKKAEEKSTLVSDLWQMRSLILHTVGCFIHRIRTDLVKIRVTIGSEDAAKSALLYGAASQFAVYVLELLGSQTKLRQEGHVAVGVDFTSEKTEADIDIRFSIRVGSVLRTLLGFGVGFFKHKIKEN